MALFAIIILPGAALAQQTPALYSPKPMTEMLDPSVIDAFIPQEPRVIDIDTAICCRVDDGVSVYEYRDSHTCPEHLAVPKDFCKARDYDCCCLADDGPGTEGRWGAKSACDRQFCQVNVLVDKDAGICRVPGPTERPPHLRPSRYTIGLAQRLNKLGQKPGKGLGQTTASLCDASKMKPGEPCWDVLLCAISAKTNNVECSFCTGGGMVCGDWSCAKKPDGSKGLCARGCMPTPQTCVKKPAPVPYRNKASCHFKQENVNDASAKAFYDLSKGNTDAFNKMVRILQAVDQHTTVIANRETFLIPLYGSGILPNRCKDDFDQNGQVVQKEVDCEKLRLSKCIFNDTYIFYQAAFKTPDGTMRQHLLTFLQGVMDYINMNLITDLGQFINNPTRGDAEIARRQAALKALKDYLRDPMAKYVKSNP